MKILINSRLREYKSFGRFMSLLLFKKWFRQYAFIIMFYATSTPNVFLCTVYFSYILIYAEEVAWAVIVWYLSVHKIKDTYKLMFFVFFWKSLLLYNLMEGFNSVVWLIEHSIMTDTKLIYSFFYLHLIKDINSWLMVRRWVIITSILLHNNKRRRQTAPILEHMKPSGCFFT